MGFIAIGLQSVAALFRITRGSALATRAKGFVETSCAVLVPILAIFTVALAFNLLEGRLHDLFDVQ